VPKSLFSKCHDIHLVDSGVGKRVLIKLHVDNITE